MIILFAGAKEETRTEPFSDPRVAVGEELNLMTTFFEMRKSLKNKKRLRFLKGLEKRKLTGDSKKELWKWCFNCEGMVKCSTHGRIRTIEDANRKRVYMTQVGIPRLESCYKPLIKESMNRIVPEVMVEPYEKGGYKWVKLFNREFLVSALVLATFVGEPPSYKYAIARHRDGDKMNCHISNLVWDVLMDEGKLKRNKLKY